jgi:hypothetical protein
VVAPTFIHAAILGFDCQQSKATCNAANFGWNPFENETAYLIAAKVYVLVRK